MEHRRQVWSEGKVMWSTGVGCRRGYVEYKRQVLNEGEAMWSTGVIEKQHIKLKKCYKENLDYEVKNYTTIYGLFDFPFLFGSYHSLISLR